MVVYNQGDTHVFELQNPVMKTVQKIKRELKDTEIVEEDENQEVLDYDKIELLFQESNKMFEHDSKLLSSSLLGDYMCTVGQDRLVKMFSTKGEKTLIREIAMADPVASCLILNDKL